jgi:hypothetical protein
MQKRLAKIRQARLDIQERGILNFIILVDYEEGMSQAIGGIALDIYDEEKKRRVGTAYGCDLIRRLLLELCVDDFSEMNGQQVLVYGEGDSLSFKVKGISALKTNNPNSKPVMFNEVAEEFGL